MKLVSQQYRAWSDCTDVQDGLALYWWQRLLTFGVGRIRVKTICHPLKNTIRINYDQPCIIKLLLIPLAFLDQWSLTKPIFCTGFVQMNNQMLDILSILIAYLFKHNLLVSQNMIIILTSQLYRHTGILEISFIQVKYSSLIHQFNYQGMIM